MRRTRAVRRHILAALVLVGALWLTATVTALAQSGEGFSLRPANPDPAQPASQAYFLLAIPPGVGKGEELLVLNTGAGPVTLDLYAVDASTGSTTGAVYANQGAAPTGPGSWIKLPQAQLTVPANSTSRVPLEIQVPAGTRPGKYLAGVVAQPAAASSTPTGDQSKDKEGPFRLNTVTRVVVAVAITVPGSVERKIAVTGVRQQTGPAGTQLVVGIRNDGNVLLKPFGSLILRNSGGADRATIPLQMDTILPGGTAEFSVAWPANLPAGDYGARVVLETADALPTPVAAPAATSGGGGGGAVAAAATPVPVATARVEFASPPISVRPATPEQTTSGQTGQSGTTVVRRQPEAESSPSWLPFAVAGGVLLLAVNGVVIFMVLRRRR